MLSQISFAATDLLGAPRRVGATVLVLGALALAGVAPEATRSMTGGRSPATLSSASAGRFLLNEVAQKLSGDWDGAWRTLYPAHQRIAPRDTFVRCERATPFPASLDSIRVVSVRPADVRIPGVRHLVAGVAVTVAVELQWYGPRDPISFRHVFHLIPVNGRWSWLLSPSRYHLYQRHACGARVLRSAASSNNAHDRSGLAHPKCSGGGGATDVRRSEGRLEDRVLVAGGGAGGGGGGIGGSSGMSGGEGGSPKGHDGFAPLGSANPVTGGRGGTPSVAGTPGANAPDSAVTATGGALGVGGLGASGGVNGGGGGGGGLYGGGGGGAEFQWTTDPEREQEQQRSDHPGRRHVPHRALI